MSRLQNHFRTTFLTGIFSATPIAVTALIIWYIDDKTRAISVAITNGHYVPFLGIVIALAGIYLLGLLVTSLLGKILLTRVDRLLARIPILRDLYSAWKQISLTPAGSLGTFTQVVLIPVETGHLKALGFTSGQPISSTTSPTSDLCCVFVPASPNPMNGRLYFVPRSHCQFLPLSPEEAFKILLSTGNYLPAIAAHPTPAPVI